jgi:hypothetical protein
MTDLSRIKPSHTARASYIYVRRPSPSRFPDIPIPVLVGGTGRGAQATRNRNSGAFDGQRRSNRQATGGAQ